MIYDGYGGVGVGHWERLSYIYSPYTGKQENDRKTNDYNTTLQLYNASKTHQDALQSTIIGK